MSSESLQARVLRAAQLFKDLGLTQSDIAGAVDASQSQVSRVLAGQIVRRTKLIDEICNYADSIELGVSVEAVRNNEELLSALAQTWDGSAAHSRALAAVIRSLSVLGSSKSPR
ncbi:helix-turn-helix domain-containing protein [Roseateles sp. BYS78W]|uniref:Helix-turn-helix domain-containing protein n=1 Tax=Pelomonas candidula TaxID=3299025 RepID=A0ABW7HE77_9BURK